MSALLTNDDIDAAFSFGVGHWLCFHVFSDDLGSFDQAWRSKRNGVVVLYPRARNKLVPYPRAATVRAAQATKGDPTMWELAGLGVYGLLRRSGNFGPTEALVYYTPAGHRVRWYRCDVDEALAAWLMKEFLRRC